MAHFCTYDKTEFLDLLRQDPHLTSQELAEALTLDNLCRGINRAVTVAAVEKARSRYRRELEALGVPARIRRARLVKILKDRTGHQTLPSWVNTGSNELRLLRWLSRLEAGEDIPPRGQRELESWVRTQRSTRYVVDLTPDGVPYTRPAGQGELTAAGDLLPGGVGLLTRGET